MILNRLNLTEVFIYQKEIQFIHLEDTSIIFNVLQWILFTHILITFTVPVGYRARIYMSEVVYHIMYCTGWMKAKSNRTNYRILCDFTYNLHLQPVQVHDLVYYVHFRQLRKNEHCIWECGCLVGCMYQI